MIVENRLLRKKDYHQKEGNGILQGIEIKTGKFGDEYHLQLTLPDGEDVVLPAWRTHLTQLAHDFKDKNTDNWKGKKIHFKAVTIMSNEGKEALGWTTYVPQT